MSQDIFETIKQLIQEHNIVLFMKGTKAQPMCGFSARVVQILDHLNASYHDVNILEDESLRQGIKDFSDWPTIPQLYIGGEFIGGCDIVRELYESGELNNILKVAHDTPANNIDQSQHQRVEVEN